MAKIKNIVVGVLWLFASVCADGQNNLSRRHAVGSRQSVVDSALSQVGVREATGKNDGGAVEKYLKVCGLGKGFSWCAAFISWGYQVNGVTAFKSAWAPSWFPKNKSLDLKTSLVTPEPGDVFGLWINNRIGHVGFVYVWGEKTVKTIEGNTNAAGSREGDGVYVKRRLTKQIYAVSRWINK